MLSKAVGEIAKTFLKDGMKLDDAVLAAFRLMDEPIPAAVPKLLDRTSKYITHSGSPENPDSLGNLLMYRDNANGNVYDKVKEEASLIQKGITDLARRNDINQDELGAFRQTFAEYYARPSKSYLAQMHALRQLGLLD